LKFHVRGTHRFKLSFVDTYDGSKSPNTNRYGYWDGKAVTMSKAIWCLEAFLYAPDR
jgi:hypothetical protein